MRECLLFPKAAVQHLPCGMSEFGTNEWQGLYSRGVSMQEADVGNFVSEAPETYDLDSRRLGRRRDSRLAVAGSRGFAPAFGNDLHSSDVDDRGAADFFGASLHIA